MHRGYYKRWRKEKDSEIWDMPPLYLRTWDWILREVDYATGDLTTSLSQISEGVEWRERGALRRPSKRTVSEVLSWLVEHKMIGTEICGVGNAKYTQISVVKWETYQSGETEVVNAQKTQGKRTSHRLEESLKTPLCPPPPPLGAHTREGDLSGEGLGGEEQRQEPEAGTTQAVILIRFAKPPASDTRANLKNSGFVYDSATQIWTAPATPRARELAERYRPYLATDAATVPPASGTAPATLPGRPLATGGATGAQGAALEPAPVSLPPTSAHLQPVLKALGIQLTVKQFMTWFSAGVCSLTGDQPPRTVEVNVVSQVAAEWIRENYLPQLRDACQQVLGRVPAIEIRVPSATTAARASPPGGPPLEPAAESTP